MNVVVDGTIYSHQAYGGISRILSATLPILCDLEPALHIDLLTWSDLKQPTPQHPQITLRKMPRIVVPRFRPERVRKALERSTRTVNERIRQRHLGVLAGDVWHATYYWKPEQWPGKVITHFYDMKEELFPLPGVNPILLRQKREAAAHSDAIVCISETTRQDVIATYPLDPARVWAAPLAANPLFRQMADQAQEPLILYVGRRDRFKNFETLLRAFAAWNKRSDFTLIAAGGADWTAPERALIRELGVGDRVRWAGRVDDAALCGLYNRAAAFVYPSLYEGFGIPLLEAMACGCPVIASRIPSSVEVAGDAALYFEATDADALIDALDSAVSAGRASALVGAGLERARAYAWEESARKVLEVYRAVVG